MDGGSGGLSSDDDTHRKHLYPHSTVSTTGKLWDKRSKFTTDSDESEVSVLNKRRDFEDFLV